MVIFPMENLISYGKKGNTRKCTNQNKSFSNSAQDAEKGSNQMELLLRNFVMNVILKL